jgi:hypothetical protein
MATLARRLSKVVLFIGLFLISARYIPPSDEWTESGARAWWRAADWLGIRDPDDLYFLVWVTIELIAAALAYAAIVKLWQLYHAK